MDSDQSFDVPEEKIPLIVLTPEIVADYTQYAEVPKMETDNYSRVGAPAHIWMPRVSSKPYLRTGVLYSRLDLYGATRPTTNSRYNLNMRNRPTSSGQTSPTDGIFTNIIAGTVSGNFGLMVRVAKRSFLTASYEI